MIFAVSGFRTLVLAAFRNALAAFLAVFRNALAAFLAVSRMVSAARVRPSHRTLAAFLVCLAFAPLATFAQDSKSATLATELARLLDEAKLDAIAAKVGASDQYVGAMYYKGTQLLVVSAKFPNPPRMNYLLNEKNYKDMYYDLSSATDPKTRTFIMDLGANGLRFKREDNQPFDTVDTNGRSVAFDGEWGRAKISEEDYRKAFSTTDEQYAQMLQSLIAQLKKPS